MYEVTIKKDFSAAHRLKEAGGKCEGLHGHNFIVEVTVAGTELDKCDLLIDFRMLKKMTTEVLDHFDHKYLNEINFFKEVNPSSEQLARFIFQSIKEKLDIPHVKLSRVMIWESEDAKVTYYND